MQKKTAFSTPYSQVPPHQVLQRRLRRDLHPRLKLSHGGRSGRGGGRTNTLSAPAVVLAPRTTIYTGRMGFATSRMAMGPQALRWGGARSISRLLRVHQVLRTPHRVSHWLPLGRKNSRPRCIRLARSARVRFVLARSSSRLFRKLKILPILFSTPPFHQGFSLEPGPASDKSQSSTRKSESGTRTNKQTGFQESFHIPKTNEFS